MDHAFFIVSSYVVTLIVIGALTGLMIYDQRVQKRALADLEARGRRRGGAAEPAQAPSASSASSAPSAPAP